MTVGGGGVGVELASNRNQYQKLKNGVFWDVTSCGSYESHTA
jgi:hypothetical protein